MKSGAVGAPEGRPRSKVLGCWGFGGRPLCNIMDCWGFARSPPEQSYGLLGFRKVHLRAIFWVVGVPQGRPPSNIWDCWGSARSNYCQEFDLSGLRRSVPWRGDGPAKFHRCSDCQGDHLLQPQHAQSLLGGAYVGAATAAFIGRIPTCCNRNIPRSQILTFLSQNLS